MEKYIAACLDGDVDKVTFMLKYEGTKMKSDAFLNKCLENACEGGHYEIFRLIMDYRDITDCIDYYIIHLACKSGNMDIISQLSDIITNGRNGSNNRIGRLNTEEIHYNAISGICYSGKLDIFKLYIEKYPLDLSTLEYHFQKIVRSGNLLNL